MGDYPGDLALRLFLVLYTFLTLLRTHGLSLLSFPHVATQTGVDQLLFFSSRALGGWQGEARRGFWVSGVRIFLPNPLWQEQAAVAAF